MELKTINIKGNEYMQVCERIRAFRAWHPLWSIETAMADNANGCVLMTATIKDEHGRVLATGHAFEKKDSSFINQTSYIENCETSAVGRALGISGIGVDTAIASAKKSQRRKQISRHGRARIAMALPMPAPQLLHTCFKKLCKCRRDDMGE